MNISILLMVFLFAFCFLLAQKQIKTLKEQIRDNNLELHELNKTVYERNKVLNISLDELTEQAAG